MTRWTITKIPQNQEAPYQALFWPTEDAVAEQLGYWPSYETAEAVCKRRERQMTDTPITAREALEAADKLLRNDHDEQTDGDFLADMRAKVDAALSVQPAREGRDERLFWFLKILDTMGGQSDASDTKFWWINEFCADRPTEPDTYNLAEELKLTRTGHDNSYDTSTVYLTDKGKEWLAAALSAAPAPVETGWQDIATAPKGKRVLVCFTFCGRLRRAIARYYGPNTLESEETESGYAEPGWYEEVLSQEELPSLDGEPVYWMPLPPLPPAPSTGEG